MGMQLVGSRIRHTFIESFGCLRGSGEDVRDTERKESNGPHPGERKSGGRDRTMSKQPGSSAAPPQAAGTSTHLGWWGWGLQVQREVRLSL